MMSPDERQIRNESTVDQLLLACDSITKRALSCRTFGNENTHHQQQQQQQLMIMDSDDDSDIFALIQKEKETEAWLERQIVDYRIRLSVLQSQTDSGGEVDHHNDNTTEVINRLQGDIFDESVRIQQERMLFHRIAMSTPALQAISPPSDGTSETDASERVLLKYSLRERDDQATKVLETIRKLDTLKIEIQNVAEESQQVQEKNRALMNELQMRHKGQLQRPISLDSTAPTTPDERSIAKENLILRRALCDMIVEGKLDWYADDRLRSTLLKLELN